MKTQNFMELIQAITKRDFQIATKDAEINMESEYRIYRILPVSGRDVNFYFKTPKNEENLVRSFINQYCKKYREPNPAKYDGSYYGSTSWENMTEKEREFCYYHHASNMFSEKTLLEQIKENLNDPSIEETLCQYGFYETNYGIGIFVLFSGKYELNAIEKMAMYLKSKNIPFSNEYSNARWVFRFILNISKDIHREILNSFR
jgi:hypothetical protein